MQFGLYKQKLETFTYIKTENANVQLFGVLFLEQNTEWVCEKLERRNFAKNSLLCLFHNNRIFSIRLLDLPDIRLNPVCIRQ